MRYAIKSHIWAIGGTSSPSAEMSDWKYSIYIVQLTDGYIRNDSFMTLRLMLLDVLSTVYSVLYAGRQIYLSSL